jgi:hypothetical protein
MPAVLAAGEPLAERRLVVSLHHAHQLVLILAISLAQVGGTCGGQVMGRVILPMVEPGDLLDLGRVVRTCGCYRRHLRGTIAT